MFGKRILYIPYRSVYRYKVSFSSTWVRFVKIIKELRNVYHLEIPLSLIWLSSFLCAVSLTNKDRGRELRKTMTFFWFYQTSFTIKLSKSHGSVVFLGI